VRQADRTLGQLAVVNFKSTNSLIKVGGTCFQNTDPKNPPVAASDVQVQQGKLESSNVGVPEAAMRLVGVMRQFEMLQKAVSLGVEMDTKSIQEVARVGS
jgi:flagellar basal-body rod protein FlgG